MNKRRKVDSLFFLLLLLSTSCSSSHYKELSAQTSAPSSSIFISSVQNRSALSLPPSILTYLKKELSYRLTESQTIPSKPSSPKIGHTQLTSKKEARFIISLKCLPSETTNPFTLSILVKVVDQAPGKQKVTWEHVFSTPVSLENPSSFAELSSLPPQESHLKTTPLGMAATKLARQMEHSISEWIHERQDLSLSPFFELEQ